MARKYNTRHSRNHGGYLQRLVRRGLTSPPRMDSVENLRDVQERRKIRTGFPWWTPRSDPATETTPEVAEKEVA